MRRERALAAIRLEPTDRIPHWESLSNPSFEQAHTGIDPWEHPRLARKRLLEMLPIDVGGVPESDERIQKLPDGELTFEDSEGRKQARWGTGKTWHWDWGHRFRSIEDALAYDPLEDMDLRGKGLVADYDYRLSVEELAAQFQSELDADRQATGELALVIPSFYNTLFMWPLLTFGWELMLELGALHQEAMKRLLAQFAELSRKAFQAWAKTDTEAFVSHDDICFARGPVFRPEWLREMIYPYYEEFWGYLRANGTKVIFISDGNVDLVADDIFACGADGIRSEPYTDWRAMGRKHPDKAMIGDGDNRALMTNDRGAIRKMVKNMADFGKDLPGYFFGIGNHIPWNVPVEAVQAYFEASQEFGTR
ncbi:MAG: uroporphyrinogen decarboxylase family protein [Planctomycetota bacterium]